MYDTWLNVMCSWVILWQEVFAFAATKHINKLPSMISSSRPNSLRQTCSRRISVRTYFIFIYWGCSVSTLIFYVIVFHVIFPIDTKINILVPSIFKCYHNDAIQPSQMRWFSLKLKYCLYNYKKIFFLFNFSDCEETEFECYNTRCLEMERKCDNNIDCEQGEDEMNCRKYDLGC